MEDLLFIITRTMEITGTGVVLIGALITAAKLFWRLLHGAYDTGAFAEYRSTLGRSILLGLEFLVAADIINTVAIRPTLESLAVLGGVVLIRTFLSFSLEMEIEGRWPWQRRGDNRP